MRHASEHQGPYHHDERHEPHRHHGGWGGHPGGRGKHGGRGHARMELPGAKQRAAHFAERPVYDPAIRTWLTAFLDRWIEGDTVAADAAVAG